MVSGSRLTGYDLLLICPFGFLLSSFISARSRETEREERKTRREMS